MRTSRLFAPRVVARICILFFFAVARASASEPQVVSFGDVGVSFRALKGELEIALTRSGAPFAQTRVDAGEIASYTVGSSYAEVALRSGFSIVFSGEASSRGFALLTYRYEGEATLASEEPLAWETTVFEASFFPRVKAFGTAGLKEVDGFRGSYAFLALVDPETRSGAVGGWLTSERASGIVRSSKTSEGAPVMTPRLDFGSFRARRGEVFEERFVLGAFDDCRLGLEAYADAIAAHYSIRLRNDCLSGYCTWYSDKHGGASDENSMKELVGALVEDFGDFGLQYVQIDDRWQLGASKNGPNKNFTAHRPNGPYPSGIKATADYLNSNGLVAGLWFMPFSGNFDDPWFQDKQDLFVRSAIDYPEEGQKNTRRYSSINQKRGAPYETFWGGTCLDASNPKTRDYIRDVVDRITQTWNCKFIKIDGMWCGAGIEQLYVNDEYMPDDIGNQIFHNSNATNIEVFRSGLKLVRDASKDAFILGCNVSQNMRVLASSYGLVDAMRIGPDNGASWNGVCAGPIRGTNRYFYNARVWINDPDPVYARNSIPLERARVSATWAALTGQLFALSDWVPDYAPERVDLVRKTIANHGCKTVRPVDLFDVELARVWLLTDDRSGVRRDVVGLFNWDENAPAEFELTPEKLGLPVVDEQGRKIEKYVAYEFWSDRFVEPFSNFKATIPPASCAVYAVRPVGERPALLSSSRHVAQCVLDVEKETWDPETRTLQIATNVPKKLAYELRVYNPETETLDRFVLPESAAGKKATVLYRPDETPEKRFELR